MSETPWLTAYDPGVRPFIHIPDISLSGLFQQAAKQHPDRLAVIHQNVSWTYSKLLAKVKSLSFFFKSRQVSVGDRILMVMENSPEWLVTFLAVAQVGAEAVLICPYLPDEELRDKALRSRAVGIVADELTFDRLFSEGTEFFWQWAVHHCRNQDKAVWQEAEFTSGVFEFSKILESKSESVWYEMNRHPIPSHLEWTLLQFGEGLHGEAIQLQHRSLLANAYQVREWLQGVYPVEKILVAVPFSYAFSLSLGIILALTLGAALIIPKEGDFFDTIQAIHDYAPEVVVASAKVYSTMAEFKTEAAQEYLFWPVQVWLSVLGHLAPRRMVAFQKLTGRPVIETFGVKGCVMTHVNPVLKARLGSIGVPVSNTDAKIVDLVTGKKCLAAGEVGELVVAGDQLPESTWLSKTEMGQPFSYSGKLAWMDQDGFFYVLGGKEEAIVSGGRIIFPREVETVLLNHPAVKKCVCVGLKDHRGEGFITALIVLNQEVSEHEILAYCRLNLSPYKVPRRLEIHQNLLRTRDGRILRLSMTEQETHKEKGYLQ